MGGLSGIGFGGGQSKSSGQSAQFGTASNRDQLPFFQNLWGQAQGFMPQAQQQAGTGQNWIQGAQQTLQGQMNPQDIQNQMGYYGQQVGQQFRENIMPQIQGQASLAGGLGSSRNQLAQGYAGAQANQQLQNMGNQLYSDNANRAQNAAGMMPGMANAFGQMGWSPYQGMAGILGQLQMQNLGGFGTQASSSWNADGKMGMK